MLGRLLGRRDVSPDNTPDDVVIRRGRWIPLVGGWLSGHRQPAAAVALGRTIVVHPDVRLTQRLLRHELAHVRQWRERPLTFPLHYTLQHMRYGYRANPYEVEAREAEHNDTMQ